MRLRLILLAICAVPLLAQNNGPTYHLDWGVRTRVLGQRLFGLPAVGETVPGAVMAQVRNFPRDWGRDREGLGKRLASEYGQFAIRELTEYFVAPALNEDPRYERLGDVFPLHQRLKRTMVGTVWVRKLQGSGHTFCYSRVVGVYASWGIASRWHPAQHHGLSEVAWRGATRLGVEVGGNAFREFWPDVRKRLKRH